MTLEVVAKSAAKRKPVPVGKSGPRDVNKKRTTSDHSMLTGVLRTLLRHIDGVDQKRLDGYLRSANWPALYAWSGRAATAVYSSASKHFAYNQISALVLKYPWDWREIALTVDPETNARMKSAAAEKRCGTTNKRVRSKGFLSSRFFPLVEEVRAWVHKMLGQEPCLERIYSGCRFTTGAAIGIHGNATHLVRKLSADEWTVTVNARAHFLQALLGNQQMALALLREESSRGLDDPMFGDVVSYDEAAVLAAVHRKLKVVAGNSLTYVPKNAETLRAVRVEPLANSFVQSGIDAEMRRRLKHYGYDLTDQRKNQALARIGSAHGTFATIDLSSASDTVALEMVKWLVPEKWYALLNDTRSPSEVHGGRYNMFASMGNGYCFPLETLLFAAIARAAMHVTGCADKAHAVYGDDIIVPTEAAALTITLLKYCGFKPNEKKTFVDGAFRESCGADWYRGQDVRPVYMDYRLGNLNEAMVFHNATYRSPACDQLFVEARQLIREKFPNGPLFPLVGYVSVKSAERVDVWNANGAFFVAPDLAMTCRYARWDRAEWRWKHAIYFFRPVEDQKAYGPLSTNARYLAFLSGQTGGSPTLRRKTLRTRMWK